MQRIGRMVAMQQLWERYQAQQPLTRLDRECLGVLGPEPKPILDHSMTDTTKEADR